MGFHGRVPVGFAALCAIWAVACAGDSGPAATDTTYTLSCPAAPASCGALAENTCLRPDGAAEGSRELFLIDDEIACDGDQAVVICEVAEASDGRRILNLETSVGNSFGFEVRVVVGAEDSMISGSCDVTVVENGLAYGGSLGGCGIEDPTPEQPCKLSNFSVGGSDGADISFDVICEDLVSPTAVTGFDVNGTVRYARCD
ncbi:MAG: hypothetical protein WBG86_09840 [Polyangiales bacterium]